MYRSVKLTPYFIPPPQPPEAIEPTLPLGWLRVMKYSYGVDMAVFVHYVDVS